MENTIVFFIDIYLRSGAKLTVTTACENPRGLPGAVIRKQYMKGFEWVFSKPEAGSKAKDSIQFGSTRIRTSDIIAMEAYE